jgi:hypothetical protein
MAVSSNRRLSLALAAVALIGALIALSGLVPKSCGRDESSVAIQPRRMPPPPAGSAELAVLAPIAPGSSFEGWKVAHISAVHHGAIRIDLERTGERAALTIYASKAGPPPPPATVGPYAVYYSAKQASEGDKLARALAKVLERHRDAPVPVGLGAFREDSRNE